MPFISAGKSVLYQRDSLSEKGDDVKTARLVVAGAALRKIPARAVYDALLLLPANGFRSVPAARVFAVFYFNKNEILPVPCDQIDLPPAYTCNYTQGSDSRAASDTAPPAFHMQFLPPVYSICLLPSLSKRRLKIFLIFLYHRKLPMKLRLWIGDGPYFRIASICAAEP